jgi:hypothetical protein
MRQTRHEKVAAAIATLVRRNADLTDAAIAAEVKLPEPDITEMLDTRLSHVWAKLPIGWKIGRAENAVIVYRP